MPGSRACLIAAALAMAACGSAGNDTSPVSASGWAELVCDARRDIERSLLGSDAYHDAILDMLIYTMAWAKDSGNLDREFPWFDPPPPEYEEWLNGLLSDCTDAST